MAEKEHRVGARWWLTLDVVLLTMARQGICVRVTALCVARDNLHWFRRKRPVLMTDSSARWHESKGVS